MAGGQRCRGWSFADVPDGPVDRGIGGSTGCAGCHSCGGGTLSGIPFQTVDWGTVAPTNHPGESGTATWRTREVGNVRVRLVDYAPGYLADHWCERGHVIHVIAGELTTELRDGRAFTLVAGQSYLVADGDGAHRSRTTIGARLFIVD